MPDIKRCPICGAECARDEVDIGVGVQHGFWRCTTCTWNEEFGDDEETTQKRVEVAKGEIEKSQKC